MHSTISLLPPPCVTTICQEELLCRPGRGLKPPLSASSRSQKTQFYSPQVAALMAPPGDHNGLPNSLPTIYLLISHKLNSAFDILGNGNYFTKLVIGVTLILWSYVISSNAPKDSAIFCMCVLINFNIWIVLWIFFHRQWCQYRDQAVTNNICIKQTQTSISGSDLEFCDEMSCPLGWRDGFTPLMFVGRSTLWLQEKRCPPLALWSTFSRSDEVCPQTNDRTSSTYVVPGMGSSN